MAVLTEDPCFCRFAQLLESFFASRFRVHSHYRLRSRKAITHPRPVIKDELQPIRPYHACNSVAAKLVAKGGAWVGLTDSDDIAAEQREGAPIMALPLTDESLLIPNTVGIVHGASHRLAAERLFEYLQRPEIVEKLVAAHALEGVSSHEITTPTLRPDWDRMLGDLDAGTAKLKEIFLR